MYPGPRLVVPASALVVAVACAVAAATPRAPARPATTDIETTLFLVGDAGAPAARFEPVLAALAADIARNEAPAIVAFLGDNVYPSGMPQRGHADRAEAERRLSAQIEAAVEPGGEAIFIPGNHDWNYAGERGLERVREQERFVEAVGAGRARFLPDNGCAGPVALDIGERLRLIAIDTQWWLQDPAARADGAPCPARTESEIVAALGRLLHDAGARHVIALGHHPLQTGGSHGGHFTVTQHLFPLRGFASWAWLPLPGFGSIYPLARRAGISDQDLAGDRNRRMRAALESAMRVDPPLAFVSGHEHNLQLLEGTSARWIVVSGGGIHGHATAVRRLDATLFAAARSGYIRLDVQSDGRVRLGVIVVSDEGEGKEVYARDLTTGPSASLPESRAADPRDGERR